MNSNRETLVNPLGQTTTFGYDPLNRLKTLAHSDNLTPNVTYDYDANGNRTTMGDGTGTTAYGVVNLSYSKAEEGSRRRV